MEIHLTWKKKFFSNSYILYSEGKEVGNLKNNFFSQTATGELFGKKYTFKTKGIITQRTDIIDDTTQKSLGEISYSNWMTKAILTTGKTVTNWEYDNLGNTKWSMKNPEKGVIQYSGGTTKGQLEANTDDPVLILSGLFITNYYWQITLLLIVIILAGVSR